MMKLLIMIWILAVIAFAGYKGYEYFQRREALERSRTAETATTPLPQDRTDEPEAEKPVHTVIQSSDKFFTNKKVYTNEDIKKLDAKKKRKGVITKEEMQKYHKK